MKKAVRSIKEFAALAAEIEKLPNEMDRIAAFCDCYVTEDAVPKNLLHGDPFSAGYHQACKEFLIALAGIDGYDPRKNERSDFLDGLESGHYVPSVYRYSDSRMLGDSFSATGAIFQTLDVRAGDSILEYGAGDGQMALALARMGCDVTVVDIDERYLRIIDRQAEAMGVRINTVHGLFGDPVPGKQFDRIIFYEAFHHSLEHAETLIKLRANLKPTGRLVLAGEPIMARDSYWRPIVPFAWGPRLDGLSLRSTRSHGWCELGFQREYLIEKMMRAGWLVRFTKCIATDRGDVYQAELAGQTVTVGTPYVIETIVNDDGWFDGEGATRWTRGNASIGLDQTKQAPNISVVLHNFLPVERHVVLTVGKNRLGAILEAGETRTVALDLPDGYATLHITCEPKSISGVIPGSGDDRRVGIAVSTITYGC